MQLELDAGDAAVRITGHGPGWLAINGERRTGALRVSNDSCAEIEDPPASVDGFEPSLLDGVAAEGPAVVLLGTGAEFAPAPPALVARFASAGIGVEAMSTPAAARTFNLVAGEGRQVVALLLPPV